MNKLAVKGVAAAAFAALVAIGSANCEAAGGYDRAEKYSMDPVRSDGSDESDGSFSRTFSASNVVDRVTTNLVQETAMDNAINALGIGVTNYSVDLYATWAPNAPRGAVKVGGGLMGLYDFNENAAAGIGIDWLGQFSLVSANLQLQAPFHLSTVLPVLADVPVIGTAEIDPFAIGGIGTPYSGNGHFNGSPMVISDLGGAVQFGHLWGGQFNAGAAWGKWVGSGPYGNVVRYHAFAGYSHGIGAVENAGADIGP